MALLGGQLVISLVMVSIIQKLGPHCSFSKWLLCSTGLIRYLYPTDDELRRSAGVPKEKPKGKKSGKYLENGRSIDTFHVPRNLDIQLETARVTALDVVHLRYYSEYQWFVDYCLYATIVYIMTEVYGLYVPLKGDFNLSMIWCGIGFIFSLKQLLSLTAQYFRGEESVGERSTVLVAGFIYLLIAMGVMLVDERILETGLDEAYESFNNSASQLLQHGQYGLKSRGPASPLLLKLGLAVWCGLVGALMTFPGLRVARMHYDSVVVITESEIKRGVLNVCFTLPFLVFLLWIRPVSVDYITVRIYGGMDRPLMSVPCFESIRICMIVWTVILRVLLMPTYLQAYLNMAYNRLQDLKKEAGRITNIELQKKIAAVFYYMCVVALQYIAPIMMCLFLALMYKNLGGYTWDGSHKYPLVTEDVKIENVKMDPHQQWFDTPSTNEGVESIRRSAQQFAFAYSSLKQIFTVEVFRGLLGFMTWWTSFVLFTSSALGMLYQTYFRCY